MEILLGTTPDFGALLLFYFWEKVYYKTTEPSFPSDSTEKFGRFVGIAEHVGHALTFKVLTEDTNKVIYRSQIRSASNPLERNKRVDPIKDESISEILKSKHDQKLKDGTKLPTLDPTDLIGRTFLKEPEEDGSRFRARIIEAIMDNKQNIEDQPEMIKFRCSVNDDEYEEIVSYNDIINHIEKDHIELGD